MQVSASACQPIKHDCQHYYFYFSTRLKNIWQVVRCEPTVSNWPRWRKASLQIMPLQKRIRHLSFQMTMKIALQAIRHLAFGRLPYPPGSILHLIVFGRLRAQRNMNGESVSESRPWGSRHFYRYTYLIFPYFWRINLTNNH